MLKAERKLILAGLVSKQGNKCYYCNCEMNRIVNDLQSATIEHLVDKWSSHKHVKDDSVSNLVAACFKCNNTRGSLRNTIARTYYKKLTMEKGIKLAVASISSRNLYKMFGPVPQHLFIMKEIENA